MSDFGIPQRTDQHFDTELTCGDVAPYGVHERDRWVVPASLNQISAGALFADPTVSLFDRRPQTYDDMFRLAVARSPERDVLICGNRRWTYQYLDEQVDHVASGLVAAGLKKGDRWP